MDNINLYTMPGCPKCEILKKKCLSSRYIADNDFRVCEVDTSNPQDAYMMFLQEHNVENMPVLLVNNTLYDFAGALAFLKDTEVYEV